jgi:ubiquinone/menaquinone biosynthesis C-methylase UbiE
VLIPAFAKAKGYEPRGYDGRLERLFDRDLESRDDFLTAHRKWVAADLRKAAMARALEILKDAGIDPGAELGVKKLATLMQDDPILANNCWHYVRGQQQMWRELQMACDARKDELTAEMEREDGRGPGTLELNPTMALPKYTKEEIHNQPGGYVGYEFAGHIYYYGTNNFWTGNNYQDQMHAKLAAETPVPADGKVKRILDMGCGDGRLTMALKDRYPNAEVWGIDVGGPMVRFAHMRANDMNNGANFAQRLAEDTKFPDGYFDVVTSFLLFHEVNADANKKILAESSRILRPGGVMSANDIRPQRAKLSGYNAFWQWFNTRWNYEVWMLEHLATDYVAVLNDRGFSTSANKAGGMLSGGVIAIKT